MTDDDLVSQAEITARLGLSRQRFQVLSRREDFPRPVAAPGGRRIWRWVEVKEWDAGRDKSTRPNRRKV